MTRSILVAGLILALASLTCLGWATYGGRTYDGSVSDWLVAGDLYDNYPNAATAWAAPSSVEIQIVEDDKLIEPVPGHPEITDYKYGGEWFDIEALYIDFHEYQVGSDWYFTGLSWCLVTSWDAQNLPNTTNWWAATGAEWDSNSNPPDKWGLPNVGAWANSAYRPQPVIAIETGQGQDPRTVAGYERLAGWDYGLVLADDSEVGTGSSSYAGLEANSGGGFTPTLYATENDLWRGGDCDLGAGEIPAFRPVDFDIANADEVSGASYASSFGKAFGLSPDVVDPSEADKVYEEDASNRVLGWPEADYGKNPKYNWVWEGEVTFATAAPLDEENTIVHYALYCANDVGDRVDNFGSTGRVPEPASMGLLALACVGIGGTLKRRRKK